MADEGTSCHSAWSEVQCPRENAEITTTTMDKPFSVFVTSKARDHCEAIVASSSADDYPLKRQQPDASQELQDLPER